MKELDAPQDWSQEVACFAMAAKAAEFSLEDLKATYDATFDALRIPLPHGMRPILVEHERESDQWMRGFHGTTTRGVVSILKDGFLKGLEWVDGGAGTHGVYGILTLHPKDGPSIERLLKKAQEHNKNQCNAIFEFLAYGTHQVVLQGGVNADQQLAKKGFIAHNKRDGRWCIPAGHLRLEAIILFRKALQRLPEELGHKGFW
jgi:hypothetical protein